MLVASVLVRLVAVAYGLLQIPSLVTVYYSFRFDKSVKGEGTGKTDHPSNGGFMSAGVCALGKAAGVLIFVWTLVSTAVVYYASFTDPIEEDVLLGTVVANSVLVIVLIVVATVMNPGLSVRSLPFYAIQAACSVVLYAAHFVVRHESHEADITTNDKLAIAVGVTLAIVLILSMICSALF